MNIYHIRIYTQFILYSLTTIGLTCLVNIPSALSIELSTMDKSERTTAVPLEQVQNLLIETLALTERGLQDSTALRQTVSERLAQAGFTPILEKSTPHDILIRIKCEERKSQTGPSQHRKGGHSLSMVSRHWKGPACSISYRYQGESALWSWEVRTSFEEAREAAKVAGASNSGLYALQELQRQLAQDEFPLYLAAEWGQADRLIALLRQSTDQVDRQRLILQLLGPLNSKAALPTIKEATTNPNLAVTAIAALGDQGEVAISSLVNILKSSQSSELRFAALQALRVIATHSSPPTLYDVFVEQLESQDPRMQTVAVRGLGSLGDLRAITPIEALNLQTWSNPSTHPDMKALREALNWSLFQLAPSSHW